MPYATTPDPYRLPRESVVHAPRLKADVLVRAKHQGSCPGPQVVRRRGAPEGRVECFRRGCPVLLRQGEQARVTSLDGAAHHVGQVGEHSQSHLAVWAVQQGMKVLWRLGEKGIRDLYELSPPSGKFLLSGTATKLP